MAMLRFDGDVHEFFVLLKQCSIRFAALRFVRDDRDDGSKLASTDLPDVKIRNDGITIALDSAPDFHRQVGAFRSYVQQNNPGIAQERVRPGENDSATDDSHNWIQPTPSEEFA